MAERQLPGGRAAKGRRLSSFRPMPRGEAGIVVDNGVVPERSDEEQQEETEPAARRRRRREPEADNPQPPGPEAAEQAAAVTMAVPLLAQFGQALVDSGQLDPQLAIDQHRRQREALTELRLAMLRAASRRVSAATAAAQQAKMLRLVRTCYRLAFESLEASEAILTPALAHSGRTAQATAGARRVIELDPTSEPGQSLLDAGREAIDRTDPGMAVVHSGDVAVVAHHHRPRIEDLA
jgi:hypothetical protein